VLDDPRVDRDASEQLGVRSVTVMPLIRDAELVGVFELFSSLPNAFGESAEQKLEALGGQVLSSLERSVQPPPAPPEPPPDRPIQDILPEEPEIPVSRRSFDWITSILGIAVLGCAILLGILIGGHLKMQRRVVRAYPAQSSALAVKPAGLEHKSDNSGATSKEPGENPSKGQSAPKPVDRTSVPEGGLLIFENGKEVFRMPAEPKAEKKQMAPASSAQPNNTLPLSPAEVESGLLHRVEPEYPEGARQAGIQGAVVLDILIGVDGAVQSVRLVSGPPELAQAAIDAVKQWRFKPRVVDGHQAGVQTTLTLSFKLPPQ
jgi:TonB family protein